MAFCLTGDNDSILLVHSVEWLVNQIKARWSTRLSGLAEGMVSFAIVDAFDKNAHRSMWVTQLRL